MDHRHLLQLLFYPLLLQHLLIPTSAALLQQGQTSSLLYLQQDVRLEGQGLQTLSNPAPGQGYGCVQKCTQMSGCRVVSMSPDGSFCALGGQVSVCQPGVVTPAAGWNTYYKALYNYGDDSCVIQLRSKASGDLCLDKAKDVATTVQDTTVMETTTQQPTTQPTTMPTTAQTTVPTTELTTKQTTMSATTAPTPTPTAAQVSVPLTSAATWEENTESTLTETSATTTKTILTKTVYTETKITTTEEPQESTHKEVITMEVNHQTSSMPSPTTIMTTQEGETTSEESTTQTLDSTTSIPTTTEEPTDSGSFKEVKEGGNCTSFTVKSPGLSGQPGTISLRYSSMEEGVEYYLMTRDKQVGIAAGSGSTRTGSGFVEEGTFCPVLEEGGAGLYRLVQNGTEQLSIVGGRLVLLPVGGQGSDSSLFYL